MKSRYTVDELMAQTFATGRTPRSAAYKSGVRAKLDHHINKVPIQCPASAGTAEFDAFYAGMDEGRSVILMTTQGATV